jgi:hypothetical protein
MARTPTDRKPGPSTVRSASVECLGGGVAAADATDSMAWVWNGGGDERECSATLTPLIRQPGHLQPQNGTNHRLIKQFDDSYHFEVKLETDNEVRAARVDC